jgi:hypothetical protein
MRTHRRLWVVLVVVISAVAAATIAGTMTARHGETAFTRDEMPSALGRHLEQLKQAIPGKGGESSEGPGGAAAEHFAQLAYPNSDIAASQIDAARAAAGTLATKFPRGKGAKGSWVSVGPSEALYPAGPFRSSFSYVPAAYYAGGRTTAIAISPNCKPGDCTLWIAAAGGGIWRTRNALNGQPSWTFLTGSFGIQSVSSITVDPNDASGNTIWVGTGEANASGDSAAGVGIYKSTNGGDTWTGPLGGDVFKYRAVGTIAVQQGHPNVVFAGTTRAVLGVSSVAGGAVSIIPGAPQWGLYKSTDGGASWTFVFNGSADKTLCTGDATEAANGTPCSPRGVRRVAFDPTNPSTLYAGAYARGIWRSTDLGATWTQIKASLNSGQTTTRSEFAVTTLANGKTRMYAAEGNVGAPYSRLFRSDDVATGTPTFTDLTSSNPADPGYGSYNYCTGQCWYDNYVYTPKGYPDVVYLLGAYQYGETGAVSNGRGVVLSRDAGVSFTDQTMDATDPIHPNGLHPDEHFLVTNPNNPYQFFEGSDGGLMRSSGSLADASSWCGSRGLGATSLARCQQLLSAVPSELQSMNRGLTTLQFQSLSVSPFNANVLQGGTQDNGTWESDGNQVKWLNTMIGDGGQSGFDVSNKDFRFHTFFDASPDVNFSGGETRDWNWIADPIYGFAGNPFYVALITDPKVSGTMFVGTARGLYRTQDFGMGGMSLAEFRQHCNEWTGDFTVQCGDWVRIGPNLGTVVAVERAPSDTDTAWVAGSGGQLYISKNVQAAASSVTYTRLDTLSGGKAPGRFVSGIYVDPADPNHAWISYTGFNSSTPSTPGHVFEVTYDPGAGTASWTDLSNDLGDIPVNDVIRDDASGTLYIATDFGVYSLASGATSWTLAAPGMPSGEVAGLTYVPGSRIVYAATHGMGAWRLNVG